MKVGDLVRHKNAPLERLRIFKISETVATVHRIDEPKVWYGGRQLMDYRIYICSIENLENETKTRR